MPESLDPVFLASRLPSPAHMGRLSYFLHNEQITAARYYGPMLRQALSAFAGEPVLLTLDTSMLNETP